MNNIMIERTVSKKDAYILKEPKKGYKIPIVSDTMFLAMINNEKRKKYAAYLISKVINVNYKEVYDNLIFMKEKLDKYKYIDKGKTVDFVCKIKGEIIGIEMNNNKKVKPSLERNISYAADLYKSNLNKGEVYHYNKVIQININNFSFKDNNKVIEKYTLKNEEGEIFTDKLEFIHIYLPNIRKKMYNELSDLERLLLVFNEDANDSEEIAKGDKIMEEYVKDAIDTSYDDEVIGLYDKELHLEKLRLSELELEKQEARREGLEEGREEGIKEGREEEQLTIAKNMLKKGIDKETIVECTGLPISKLNDN